MSQETDDIERQLRLQHARESGEARYVRKQSGNDGMHKRILEALITAAVIALIVAVWNMTQTVALLQAAQDSQRRDIDRLERRQDSLEGKITRGETNALDQ